jgi:putative peptidoglycan lipid II flippase
VRIVVSAFYAMQDTLTPVKTATVSIGANIIFGLALMGPMRHGGLALATSLASMINLTLLVGVIAKRLEAIRWRAIALSGFKTVAASAIMALMVLWIRGTLLTPGADSGGIHLLIGTGAAVGGGIVVFCAAARLLRIPEWQKTVALMKRRLNRA